MDAIVQKTLTELGRNPRSSIGTMALIRKGGDPLLTALHSSESELPHVLQETVLFMVNAKGMDHGNCGFWPTSIV